MAKKAATREKGEKVWHCPIHGDFPDRFRWSAHRRYCQAGKGPKGLTKRGPGRPPKKIDPERMRQIMEKLRQAPVKAEPVKKVVPKPVVNETISVGIKKAELLLRSGADLHPVMDVYYAVLPEAVKFIKDALKNGSTVG